MSDLAVFLNARLDEEERLALDADQCAGGQWWPETGIVADGLNQPDAQFTRYWSPARMLGEVAARRAVIATVIAWSENSQDALASVLQDLASAYSDHPGYGAACR